MEKKNTFTKILTLGGLVLLWIPILTPVFFGGISLIGDGIFRFDYLMPAELFPSILVGGGLLIWAAIRARSRLKIIGWGFGVALFCLFGGQLFAVLTGLASGETEPTGWYLGVAVASLILYTLAIIVTGVGGILLAIGLYKTSTPKT